MQINVQRPFRLGMVSVVLLLTVLGFGGILIRCADVEVDTVCDSRRAESSLFYSTPISLAKSRDLGLAIVLSNNYFSEICQGAIVSSDWVITGKTDCWNGKPLQGIVRAIRSDGSNAERTIVAGVRIQNRDDISMVQLAPALTETDWPSMSRSPFLGATNELSGVKISCYGAIASVSSAVVPSWRESVGQVDSTNDSEFIFRVTGVELIRIGGPCFVNSQLAGVNWKLVSDWGDGAGGSNSRTTTSAQKYYAHYGATNRFAKDIVDITSPLKTIVHAPNGDFAQSHEGSIVHYTSDLGEDWCAKIHGNTFIHAKNCNFAYSHSATMISYKSWDNASWAATINGNTFTHAPRGDFSKAHTSTVLSYRVDGANWTMVLK